VSSALYVTIWISLVLFVAGEFGKGAALPGWAWRSSAIGALLMLAHIIISMSSVHAWSHASAITATAAQTDTVYGLNWGGGVNVNYLFITVWVAELAVWRLAPVRYAARSSGIKWTLRAFYFIVIANAAVVFAGGWRRVLGVGLIAALLVCWRRQI
jgi:hypothetical protein